MANQLLKVGKNTALFKVTGNFLTCLEPESFTLGQKKKVFGSYYVLQNIGRVGRDFFF